MIVRTAGDITSVPGLTLSVDVDAGVGDWEGDRVVVVAGGAGEESRYDMRSNQAKIKHCIRICKKWTPDIE